MADVCSAAALLTKTCQVWIDEAYLTVFVDNYNSGLQFKA